MPQGSAGWGLGNYIAGSWKIKSDSPGTISADKDYVISAATEIDAFIYAVDIVSVQYAVAWQLGCIRNRGRIEDGLRGCAGTVVLHQLVGTGGAGGIAWAVGCRQTARERGG